MPPVVVKVLLIDENTTFAVVEYLQFAFWFVVRLIVVVVVPDGNVPDGWPFVKIVGESF